MSHDTQAPRFSRVFIGSHVLEEAQKEHHHHHPGPKAKQEEGRRKGRTSPAKKSLHVRYEVGRPFAGLWGSEESGESWHGGGRPEANQPG